MAKAYSGFVKAEIRIANMDEFRQLVKEFVEAFEKVQSLATQIQDFELFVEGFAADETNVS